MNPLSMLYGATVRTRNTLYDREVLKTRRLSAPVVSVGSISAGGAGKTPFVIMLGELLQKRDVKFDVLSRGFGRTSRGALIVDPAGKASEFGDEPLLIARRLGCPVVVGESRYAAGLLAERTFASKLHILDDGFQHRSLARDFDVALVTAKDLNDQLLPFGRLREPLASLNRADVLVAPEDFELSMPGKSVWRIRRGLALADVPGRPVVFCGIARPQEFLKQIEAAGIKPAAFKAYRDHHPYSSEDVRELLKVRDAEKSGGFITTEKDGVNLGEFFDQFGRISIARVTMELIEPADALGTMFAVIERRRLNRERITSAIEL